MPTTQKPLILTAPRSLTRENAAKVFDQNYKRPNMITDERVVCLATIDGTLIFEISRGWFGARQPVLYWGVVFLRVSASGDVSKDNELNFCTDDEATLLEYIYAVVQENCSEQSARALFLDLRHKDIKACICRACKIGVLQSDCYSQDYCSYDCHDTQFLDCLGCGTHCMSAKNNLERSPIFDKTANEQLCDKCFNTKHGLIVVSLEFS